MKKILPLILSLMLIFSSVFADSERMPGQLQVTLLQSPTPMLAAGKYFLVYEIFLTNFQSGPITLSSLEVKDAESNAPLFQFKKQDLINIIHPISSKTPAKPLTLQSGETRMIFMWLPFLSKNYLPSEIIHQINFYAQNKHNTVALTTVTDPLDIKKNKLLIVGPPLRGDYWIAGNGPSSTSDHRVENAVINGNVYFAQRYAIDFIRINPEGLTFEGDEHKNQSYFCYGADVLSVANGKVVEILDNIPENTPHSGMTLIGITLQTAGGNHVVVDMGNGIYAYYAHLQQGSIKVRRGDMVKRGQVLGKVGNSGNSSEPHLHFQIVDQPSFLAANGLPYVFDNFYIRPSDVTSLIPAFQIKILNDSLQHVTNQLVLENTVMKFPVTTVKTKNRYE